MGTLANAAHREPWNKGKIVGKKAPFKLSDGLRRWCVRMHELGCLAVCQAQVDRTKEKGLEDQGLEMRWWRGGGSSFHPHFPGEVALSEGSCYTVVFTLATPLAYLLYWADGISSCPQISALECEVPVDPMGAFPTNSQQLHEFTPIRLTKLEVTCPKLRR